MASLPHSNRVTYEEWLQMPEVDDAIEEVIDGEIILMPPAKMRHARIIKKLAKALFLQLDTDVYDVLTGRFGVVISEHPLTCRTPDLAVSEVASSVEKDGYLRSAPQLIVEVLSPSETRRVNSRKLQDYATIATPEVWVISPNESAVEVFQLENGRLERTAIFTTGILKPRAFPQVEIDIAQIWPV
jgi:Uma2 family endonuclease